MIVTLFLAALIATAAIARPINIGSDPHTWSPKMEPEQNETETVDKCNACKMIVSYIEYQQKVCTVVPDNYKAICDGLVKEFPPYVICQEFCNTYIIDI